MAEEKSNIADAFSKTQVVSKPGAAIRVEKTELTGVLKQRLTTSIKSLGESRSSGSGSDQSSKKR